jgi:hypothetical protein
MNTPETYLGLITLHRSTKIRVKQYGGDFVNLHPTNVTWVDLTDDYNLKQLNHHAAVGQFLAIGQWNDVFCGEEPPTTDLSTDPWWLPLRTLNDTARVRVKGWQYDSETDTNVYGYHNLKPDVTTYIYIGYVPYDEDGSYARGLADEDDWQYNLRQLGHHNAIGQYVVTSGSNWTNIQGLNDTSHVRVYDDEYGIIRTATTRTNEIDTPQVTNLETSATGGTLIGNQQYWYTVTAVTDIGSSSIESQYGTPQAITTGGTASNEIQIFQLANEAEGTYSFTYDFNGSHEFETAAIDFDATAAQIKTALNNGFNTEFATTGVEYVTTSTGSAPNYDITIDFSGGPLAGQNVPELIANDIDLNAEVIIAVTTDTEGGDYTDTNTVTITWTQVPGATGYYVYRSIDGDFDNITSDEYRVASIEGNDITSAVDVGSTSVSAIPDPWWWTGIVQVNLDEELGRNTLNHHTTIGQYIVWPFNLTNNNND